MACATKWRHNYQRLQCLRKRTPTSVRRRSSRVDFRLRNPSSPDVVFGTNCHNKRCRVTELTEHWRATNYADSTISNTGKLKQFISKVPPSARFTLVTLVWFVIIRCWSARAIFCKVSRFHDRTVQSDFEGPGALLRENRKLSNDFLKIFTWKFSFNRCLRTTIKKIVFPNR